MFGEAGITNMENNIQALLSRDDEILMKFTKSSLEFKKNFIEEDEFDKGVRINLNYAHTFGHAFETISNYYIPHGTAVAMGTIVANRISLSRGYLTEDKVVRVEKVLNKIINIDLSKIDFDMDGIIAAIKKDKKQINSSLTAILMYDDMKLKVVHDVHRDELSNAISCMRSQLL